MFKEMNKNGLQSFMLKDSTTDKYCLTTSLIFKRYSKLQIEQLYKGTMKYDKPIGHVL